MPQDEVAVLIGVSEYDSFANVPGAVRDVENLVPLLKRHACGDPNFECEVLPAATKMPKLKERTEQLFGEDHLKALFYFSGHGGWDHRGGFLYTKETSVNDDGYRLGDLFETVRQSSIPDKVVLLDCCYSGQAGSVPFLGDAKIAPSNTAVLTATRSYGLAKDTPSGGVFTKLLCSALEGDARDINGWVTVPSVYVYLSSVLSALDQRPTLLTNVSRLIALRRAEPQVPAVILNRLPEWFPSADHVYELDHRYDNSLEPKGHECEKIMKDFYVLRNAGLMEAHGAEHFYWSCYYGGKRDEEGNLLEDPPPRGQCWREEMPKGARLTPLGERYREIAIRNTK